MKMVYRPKIKSDWKVFESSFLFFSFLFFSFLFSLFSFLFSSFIYVLRALNQIIRILAGPRIVFLIFLIKCRILCVLRALFQILRILAGILLFLCVFVIIFFIHWSTEECEDSKNLIMKKKIYLSIRNIKTILLPIYFLPWSVLLLLV